MSMDSFNADGHMDDLERETPKENHAHKFALGQLGFVHRRLPTGDERNGSHFVPRQCFDEDRERMIAIVSDEKTVLFAVNGDTGQAYNVAFHRETPGNVINQAIAAAMNNARI